VCKERKRGGTDLLRSNAQVFQRPTLIIKTPGTLAWPTRLRLAVRSAIFKARRTGYRMSYQAQPYELYTHGLYCDGSSYCVTAAFNSSCHALMLPTDEAA
jgi:hypothetical protein